VFGEFYTEWNFVTLYCDAGFVESYSHERDTFIDNHEYHIINNWGLLRESDQNAKMWYRSFDDDEEILIADLSLTLGDTFIINTQEFTVDSVYEDEGLKIVQFDYIPFHCGYYKKLKFEEGKGPNLSYVFALTADDYEAKLLRCQTKDSITVNFLEDFGFEGDCRKDVVNTIQLEIEKPQFYPNPFSENLSIKFEDSRLRTIEIYHFNGGKLFTINARSQLVDLNLSDLAQGMYFVRVLSSNGIGLSKVIKIH
jgi:hypothetical protein